MLEHSGISRRKFLAKIGFGAILGELARHRLLAAGKGPAYNQILTGIKKMRDFEVKADSFHSKGASRTVVLFNDIHGGPEAFWWKRKLSLLDGIRKNTGINVVAVEGWAGPEVDRERGFRLLNGNEAFLEHLISNPQFFVIGLENKELQEIALKEALWRHHIMHEKALKTLREMRAEPGRKHVGLELSERNEESLRKTLEREAKKLRVALNEKSLENLKRELARHFGGIFDSYEHIGEWERIEDRLAVEERSKSGMRILKSEMRKMGISTAVVVFGEAHEKYNIGELEKDRGLNVLSIMSLSEQEAMRKSR